MAVVDLDVLIFTFWSFSDINICFPKKKRRSQMRRFSYVWCLLSVAIIYRVLTLFAAWFYSSLGILLFCLIRPLCMFTFVNFPFLRFLDSPRVSTLFRYWSFPSSGIAVFFRWFPPLRDVIPLYSQWVFPIDRGLFPLSHGVYPPTSSLFLLLLLSRGPIGSHSRGGPPPPPPPLAAFPLLLVAHSPFRFLSFSRCGIMLE